MARAALVRAPNDVDVVRTYVAAAGAAAGDLDRRQAESRLSAVSTVEKEARGCADDALSLRVDVLSRVDPTAANNRLRAVVESKTPAGEATLLHLADVAARSDAALAGRILDLCESLHGVTPQLALARATRASREHGAAAGMEAFESARSRSSAAVDPLEWDLARATFVDSTGGRDAGATWIALADAHPGAIAAQLGALASESTWRDRDAVARVIERLRGLTGDGGVTWRVAHARWLLATPAAPQAQVAEAVQILNDVVRAAPRRASTHALLAGALEKLGNVAGAEEHLRIAADLAPDDASIALEIARLAQLRGRGDAGRREIERVLAQKNVPPAQMERVAYLLAVQGDLRRGAAILEPFVADGRARREGAVLLARLYARLGEPARALAVCERLLASPDAEVVELAASQYAALSRDADAAAALARLDSMTLPAGTRELVRARFAAAQGRAEATDEFRRAVDAAPSRADAWTAYLTWAVSTGAADRVRGILDDPRAAAVEPVRYLAAARAEWTAAVREPRTRALVLAAIHDVGDRPVLLDALRATEGGDGPPARAADAARAVRTLADANVKVLALQLLAADLAASAGDMTGARRTAERTSAAFPDSAAAARQAAELAAREGRWPEALQAGRRWRDRASRLDEAAETFVAEALTRTGHAADAVAALEPRIPAALEDCDRHETMLVVFAASVLRSGDAKRAVELIARLSRGSERRRSALTGVDAGLLGDAAGASRWLAACAEQTPATDAAARVELARAWSGAWDRYRAPELLSAAKDVLAGLTASPDAPAAAHLLSASLAQQEGDLAAARSGYVAALARDPRLDEARNNLAMVLADQGQWKDAVIEATKATRSSPAVPEYLDTLAYALRKGHEIDKARASLDAAIRLDPANPRWMASLAETLFEGGDAAGAAKAAARAEAMAADRGGLDPDVRDRIARLARPR
jgi:tetratricopeptide (TPR) repeat protein